MRVQIQVSCLSKIKDPSEGFATIAVGSPSSCEEVVKRLVTIGPDTGLYVRQRVVPADAPGAAYDDTVVSDRLAGAFPPGAVVRSAYDLALRGVATERTKLRGPVGYQYIIMPQSWQTGWFPISTLMEV